MSRSLLALVVLTGLTAISAAPAPVPQVHQQAACLKACAGAPRDATGQMLLTCLSRCQPADAGARE